LIRENPFIISSTAKAPQPVGYRTLIPAGSAYLNHLRLSLHHNYSFDALDNQLQAEEQRRIALTNETAVGEDDLGVGNETETEELLSLDPKEWKVYASHCLTCPRLIIHHAET
jgi:DnaJ family protein C protein 2